MNIESKYLSIAHTLLKRKKEKGETHISSSELSDYSPIEITKIFAAIEILCDTGKDLLSIKKEIINKETKERMIEFIADK